MVPQVVHHRLPIRHSVVSFHEAGVLQSAGGIVDHGDQHQPPRVTLFEPGVIGAVPLHQLSQRSSPGPRLSMPRPAPLHLPPPLFDQPPSQRVRVHLSELRIS